jgi:hypothetical protein
MSFQDETLEQGEEDIKVLKVAYEAENDPVSLQCLQELFDSIKYLKKVRILYRMIYDGSSTIDRVKIIIGLQSFFREWSISDCGVFVNIDLEKSLNAIREILEADPTVNVLSECTLFFLETISEIVAHLGYKSIEEAEPFFKFLQGGCVLVNVHTIWGFFDRLIILKNQRYLIYYVDKPRV